MNTKEKILAGKKVIIIPEDDSFEDEINEIVQSLKTHQSRDLLVPLVCEDMYEYVDPSTKETVSLHEYIVEYLISKSKTKICLNETELDDILSKGYYGMELLQDKMNKNIYEELYVAVMDEYKNVRANIRLKPVVKDFLLACRFPLIITTSCFPIIESEIEEYNSYFFLPESRNDTPLKTKCVYHIFGEAFPNNENWGYNEKQILKYLKYAYSSEYSYTNLTTFIANNNSRKSLLILGNDTPNWLFRFMLTPIYPGDIYDNGNGFYMTDHTFVDKGLNLFLNKINFKKENKVTDILKEVTKRISTTDSKIKESTDKQYDIFISHASEDNDIVKELEDRLKGNGFKVWVDYGKIDKGRYWDTIINGMRQSSYFMPLITEAYIHKTRSLKEQVNTLQLLGIKEFTFDSKQTNDIDCILGGIATELLLAEKIFSGNNSLPIILKDSTFVDEPITSERVKNWSKDSKRLPESLFYGVLSFFFDKMKPQDFNLNKENI